MSIGISADQINNLYMCLIDTNADVLYDERDEGVI